MNLPGCTRPSGPGSCCQAILAKRAPSGQGEMLPEFAAFTASSLPRTNRKVLLSPLSVTLIGFQLAKAGSKGNPSNSGCTIDRDVGAGTSTGTTPATASVFAPLLSAAPAWFAPGVHVANYPLS